MSRCFNKSAGPRAVSTPALRADRAVSDRRIRCATTRSGCLDASNGLACPFVRSRMRCGAHMANSFSGPGSVGHSESAPAARDAFFLFCERLRTNRSRRIVCQTSRSRHGIQLIRNTFRLSSRHWGALKHGLESIYTAPPSPAIRGRECVSLDTPSAGLAFLMPGRP